MEPETEQDTKNSMAPSAALLYQQMKGMALVHAELIQLLIDKKVISKSEYNQALCKPIGRFSNPKKGGEFTANTALKMIGEIKRYLELPQKHMKTEKEMIYTPEDIS
ncbi:MAG: hypothetical protein HQL69_20510 [Magnetococcales bacterium]|nr:hypothetical protein [Magnetococcales bacterium]